MNLKKKKIFVPFKITIETHIQNVKFQTYSLFNSISENPLICSSLKNPDANMVKIQIQYYSFSRAYVVE